MNRKSLMCSTSGADAIPVPVSYFAKSCALSLLGRLRVASDCTRRHGSKHPTRGLIFPIETPARVAPQATLHIFV